MATETTYSTYLQQFSVKIRYKLVGSGTLVKINNSCIYLITAKHNLKEDENSIINDTFIENLENNLNDISIERDNPEKFCIVEDIVYYGEVDLDLIIFSVRAIEGKDYLQKLPCLKILQHEHSKTKFEEYFFYGYPNDKNGTIITGLVEPDYDEEESYKFKLNGGTQKEKHLKGFSGSGLFIENNEKFYLVALVIQADATLFKYAFIDLYVILDDINMELEREGKELLLSEKLELDGERDSKSSLNNTINKSKNSNQIGDTGNNNIINQSNTTTHHHYGGIFGIIGIVLIVVIYIFYLKNESEGNVFDKKRKKYLECPKGESISVEITKSKNIFKNTNVYLDNIAIKSCTFKIGTQLKKIEFDELEKITIDTCQYNINIPKHNKNNCTIKFQLKGD